MAPTSSTNIVTDKHVRGAPALVVEIFSPATKRRDLGIKSRAYERWGVREYWLVDPDQQCVTIRRRDRTDALTNAGTLAVEAGDTLTSPLLPTFALPLAELFSRV